MTVLPSVTWHWEMLLTITNVQFCLYTDTALHRLINCSCFLVRRIIRNGESICRRICHVNTNTFSWHPLNWSEFVSTSLSDRNMHRISSNKPFIHASFCLFSRPFIRSFIHSSIHQFINSSVYSFAHLFVHAFVHSFQIFIEPFPHSFVHPFIHHSIFPFIHLFIHPSILLSTHVWIRLFVQSQRWYSIL